MTKGTGGCRCGSIRYGCASDPSMVSFFYCRDCQKASGGPFCNYAVVPVAAVTIIKGQTQSYVVEAASGNTVRREFWGECGSQLFASNKNVFVLAVGSLDDAYGICLTIAIWLDSALPWAPIPDDVDHFRQNPPITLGT
ncbi:MAG TPA: aldehyde-activating protein [Gammaproteobacteria bacterium]|nr:aldehyde-activating protein [Gammaproteobacteria bacterium]